jgi:hypothetical protein
MQHQQAVVRPLAAIKAAAAAAVFVVGSIVGDMMVAS